MKNDPMATVVAVIVAYVFGFIFTFGHAYNTIPSEEKAYLGGTEYTIRNGVGAKSTGAFLSSMFWPLYWSAQAWK